MMSTGGRVNVPDSVNLEVDMIYSQITKTILSDNVNMIRWQIQEL